MSYASSNYWLAMAISANVVSKNLFFLQPSYLILATDWASSESSPSAGSCIAASNTGALESWCHFVSVVFNSVKSPMNTFFAFVFNDYWASSLLVASIPRRYAQAASLVQSSFNLFSRTYKHSFLTSSTPKSSFPLTLSAVLITIKYLNDHTELFLTSKLIRFSTNS